MLGHVPKDQAGVGCCWPAGFRGRARLGCLTGERTLLGTNCHPASVFVSVQVTDVWPFRSKFRSQGTGIGSGRALVALPTSALSALPHFTIPPLLAMKVRKSSAGVRSFHARCSAATHRLIRLL